MHEFVDMFGSELLPLKCSSRSFDFCITFLKISEINVGLALTYPRSFPMAANPAGKSKRCLKLTSLYGTGQQEIGEFEVVGDECIIGHQLDYQFHTSDSSAATKLHVYVDEACSYGLTGHVTVDLKEFIKEHDSEVYLEYPLSQSSPYYRAARLKILLRCTAPPLEEDPDLELDRFLSDSFFQSDFHQIPEESEVKHLLPGSEFVSRISKDYGANTQGTGAVDHQINSERELGLNLKLRKSVKSLEYAHTKPNFEQSKKFEFKSSSSWNKGKLQAVVFFAAGVNLQQQVYAMQSGSGSSNPRVEKHDISSVENSLVLLRSTAQACTTIPRLNPTLEADFAEVVTFSEENLRGLDSEPSPERPSSSSTTGAEDDRRSSSRKCNACIVCPACSAAEVGDLSNSSIIDREADSHAAGATQDVKHPRFRGNRSVAVVIRNVLGVLLIAGVSFILGGEVGSLSRTKIPSVTEGLRAVNENLDPGEKTVIFDVGKLDGQAQRRSSEMYQPTEIIKLETDRNDHARQKLILGTDSDEQLPAKLQLTETQPYTRGNTRKHSMSFKGHGSREFYPRTVISHISRVRIQTADDVSEPRTDEKSTERCRTVTEAYPAEEEERQDQQWRKMLRGHRDYGAEA